VLNLPREVAQQSFGNFATRSAPKAVPPSPLLTLEGCSKDGVVSPPSASLTHTQSNPSIPAGGKQPKHPGWWKATQASRLVESNPSIPAGGK